ncbi:MAG TPA: DUF72 domain-containing protein [Candidatus Limnocylindrales bacterium]
MTAWVGTSGWQYRHWRERYYPRSLPTERWLERYAGDFAAVELNASFYHLPQPAVFAAWAERTPADFRFAVKASRYLTHVRRLREPREPVERLMAAAGRLGPKLAVVLLQLPPSMERGLDDLAATLEAFPPGVRVAVELRHPSWFTEETRQLLTERAAALCLADRRYRRTPLWRTTDWTYLRLHWGLAAPEPCYGPAALGGWARRLGEGWAAGEDAFVFFNNDPAGCAVRDAARFGRLLDRLGRPVSRVPDAAVVRVG